MLSPPSLEKASRRKIAAIVLSCLLTAIGCALFVYEINLLSNLTDRLQEKNRIAKILRNTLDALQDQETGQRGYLLTGRTTYLIPYYKGRDRLRYELPEMASLLDPAVPGEQYLENHLSELVKVKEEEFLETIELYDSGNIAVAIDHAMSDEGKFYMDLIRSMVSHYVEQYSQQIQGINDRFENHLSRARNAFLFWIAAIFSLVAVAFWNARNTQILMKAASEQLRMLAMHDPLTGLPNRRYLNEWLNKAMAEGQRYLHPVSALYIDLDGFGKINNQLGHDAGDIALKRAANLFKDSLRKSDFLARLGGDEFIIITKSHDQEELSQFAYRLIALLAAMQPGESLPKGAMGACIGIALTSKSASTPDELISQADKAMYQAKREGRGTFRFAE